MLSFREITEIKSMLDEDKLILEFANLDPDDHKMGVNLKMHIMQPGDKKLKHGARVKFFNKEHQFVITLSEDTDTMKVIGDWKVLVSERSLNTLMKNCKKYIVPLLNFWYDEQMTTGEIVKQMRKIDKGIEVKKGY